MPVFAYTALDAKGEKTSGTVPAQHRPAALDQIIRKGLTPVSVAAQQAATTKRFTLPGRQVVYRRLAWKPSSASWRIF